MSRTPKKKNDYVDNTRFYNEMVEYKAKVKEALEQGKERPMISNYIGGCLLQIAQRLSYKSNFINYTFRDEMIADGIENCLQYIDNFDPEKSTNPFSYFTQIIFYCFVRRINKEKKQLYIKMKMTENLNLLHETADHQEHDHNDYNDGIKTNEWTQEYIDDFIENFEKNKRKQVKKRKKKVDSETTDAV